MLRALFVLTLLAAAAHGATLPTGFSETVVTGLTNPTAMALAPDGRIFICQQGGALRIVKNGSLLATPFITLTVNSTGERGLLGVAIDPDFGNNQYIYLYYTATTPSIHNRISRVTANGDVALAGSEVELMNLENLSATNHNGGALHFGIDGQLYIAVGENAVTANSQTLTNRLGKVLRINSDGSIPSDNPFFGQTTGDNRSIWALGLRNPFTFGVHPNSGRIFINDVGAAAFEEINDGIAGSNYGWPQSEGPTGNPAHTGPVHHYANQNAPECAIAGGTFYAPEVRQFPSTYVESYFFSDLCGGWIRELKMNFAWSGFATGISNPVDLLAGHDGSLYYLARNGSLGRVRWTQHLEGDVNNDGTVNGSDAFYLINHIHAGGPAPAQGGDVDNNGTINAADVTYLVAYLWGRGPTPL